MMSRYLLDTNHLSLAINPVSHLREHLHQARLTGLSLGTCVPALCELEAGIEQTHAVDSYRRQLAQLLKKIRIWPIDHAVARIYGELYQELRRRGRVLSQVDIMLAALSKHMKLTLLTSDRDFEALPEVPTENWVS
jgi:tRNA(fMet)-specific endonuclease VapC